MSLTFQQQLLLVVVNKKRRNIASKIFRWKRLWQRRHCTSLWNVVVVELIKQACLSHIWVHPRKLTLSQKYFVFDLFSETKWSTTQTLFHSFKVSRSFINDVIYFSLFVQLFQSPRMIPSHHKTVTSLTDDPLVKALGGLTFWQSLWRHQKVNTGCTRSMTHQGDVARVASEFVDVLLNPVKGRNLRRLKTFR